MLEKHLLLIISMLHMSPLPSFSMKNEEEPSAQSASRSPTSAEFFKEEEDVRPEITPAIFTKDELRVIQSYAETLYNSTRPEDVVIFIGRSPFMFAYYWQCKQYEHNRQFYSVSFSGKPYGDFVDGTQRPTSEQLAGYAKYLERLGLKEKLKSLGSRGRVVLVDYVLTGKSMPQFARTLVELGLLNADSSVIFNVTSELWSQEAMNKAVKAWAAPYKFLFTYNVVAHSFIEIADVLKVSQSVGTKLTGWEFSMPGLGKFPSELWGTFDPFIFKTTGNVELVCENAKRVWG